MKKVVPTAFALLLMASSGAFSLPSVWNIALPDVGTHPAGIDTAQRGDGVILAAGGSEVAGTGACSKVDWNNVTMTCQDGMTAQQCEALHDPDGGVWTTYHGDGTECTGPTGACCFEPYYCFEGLQMSCENLIGNRFMGEGSSCQPTGACCWWNGVCVVNAQVCCEPLFEGNIFGGVGTTCEPKGCCYLWLEVPRVLEMTTEWCCKNLSEVAIYYGDGAPCVIECDCSTAEWIPKGHGTLYDDLRRARDSYNPWRNEADPGCIGHDVNGKDCAYQFCLANPGDTFTATCRLNEILPLWNVVLYIVTSCDNVHRHCVVGSDAGEDGEPETISITQQGPGPTTYWLIVDCYEQLEDPVFWGYELEYWNTGQPSQAESCTWGTLKSIYR